MGTGDHSPLAIIGMACHVPGADGLEPFWKLLIDGRCTIVEVPPDRLDRSLYYDPRRGQRCKTYTHLGGLIEYHPFDASTCPVPAKTLVSAEVGHREICQIAARACRHAGMDPFNLPLRNVGVYVGHNMGGPLACDLIYSSLVQQTAQYLRQIEPFCHAVAGREDTVIEEVIHHVRAALPRRCPDGMPDPFIHIGAAIISEAFGLSGPSMILDAACSSALQGLALASRALRLGQIDMAIVGGASYYHVDSQLIFSQAQSASATGSCPFDERADGLVSGEGYVAVLVKRLDQALADGDPIQAVISGIGVSADGRGRSLWAPRTEGQVLAMRRAYENGPDINRVQYIEAHATSTRLGDLTELKALVEMFDGRGGQSKIPLGGVKANIGHTLEAAGMIGLVKTVLAMQQGTIPGQINIEQLNKGIDWQKAPFYVPTSNVPWPEHADGHPRRAGVNSFGIGGLNVHVVLDEYRPETASAELSAIAGPPSQTARPQGATVGSSSSATNRKQEPIAVIGAGCIFPGARTLAAFGELIASGRDPKCEPPAERTGAPTKGASSDTYRGGYITDFEFDWRRHKLPPKQIAHADPLQLMILDATDAALADAGYDTRPFDNTRVGVIVGTLFGSEFGDQLEVGFRLPHFQSKLADVLRRHGVAEDQIAAIGQAYADVLLEHMPALLDETGGFTPSTLASRLTKVYDLMGGAVTVDSGAASSGAALRAAADMLADGSCDMMICAAGNRAMSLAIFEAMKLRGDLDAGYRPGEGTGVVVLKRLSDARRDGDPIRGVIRAIGAGFATSRDAAVAQAVDQAHQMAGTSADELTLIEDTDPANGEPTARGHVAGQIGHTQGAAGMASLLAAIHTLDNGTSSGATGVSPGATAGSSSSAVSGITGAVPVLPQTSARALAGVNSVDPLGAAYHVILEQGVEVPTPNSEQNSSQDSTDVSPATKKTSRGATVGLSSSTDQRTSSWRIVRVSAPSMSELAKQAGQLANKAADLYARADSLRFAAEHSCRLAIVAETPDDLAAKLTLASQSIDTPKSVMLSRKDVFVGQKTPPSGKVAFLFSGQGSQYPGMLRPLLDEYAPAADTLQQIDETLCRLGMPSFAEFAGPDSQVLGKDVWLTQLSLLCADTIVYRSLIAMGIRPDFVAGHSYGEFPALLAAGAWDLENAILGTRARCQAIEACSGVNGQMISVAASGEVVEQACRELGGQLYPANYNSPSQTVVGGDEPSIARLEQYLTSQKIACKVIPVPRPFHTPLMEPVRGPLAEGLRPIVFGQPSVSMFSNVTNQFVTEAEQIRANLVAQMTSPVRYVELINHLIDAGARAVVEVGPRQVLCGLHNKILAGRDVAVIGCDDKTRPGLSRLLAVEACLDTLGLLETRGTSDSTSGVAASLPNSAGSGATAGSPSSATSEASGLPIFTGTPREMGRQHGQMFAEQFQRIAQRWADLAGMTERDFHADAIERLPNALHEELIAMAEAADVSVEMLAAYNDWVDSHAVESIAQMAAHADGTIEMLHAVDEQPVESGGWADFLASRDLHVYRPAEGFAHAVVSPVGAIGGSSGMNDRGLAVSSVTHGSSNGGGRIMRIALVRTILQQASNVDEAVALLEGAAADTNGEWLISHAASNRVCQVRRADDGRWISSDNPIAVTLTESRTTSADLSQNLSHWGELTAIRDRLNAAGKLQTVELDRLRATARSRFGVVMSPNSGEILFRSVCEGQPAMCRYRFDSGATAGMSSSAANTVAQANRGTLAAEPISLPDQGDSGPALRYGPVAQTLPAAIPLDQYLAALQSVDGRPPFDQRGRVCSRFVLRLVETSIPTVDESLQRLNGPAMIVGSNPLGMALRKQIEALGQKAVIVPLADDVDKTLSMVEKIWDAYRPPHLFIVTPFDDDATANLAATDWDRRRRRGVMLPYLVSQKWFEQISDAKMVERASLVAATACGGDFGLSGRVESYESGAISGLIKGLCLEAGYTTNWAFRTKVIDASRSEPVDETAEAMLRELLADAMTAEIGYLAGRRYIVGAMHGPTPEPTGNRPTQGRPWLITGGARGITAAIARELGARFGVKLHLVGTSSLPAIDPAWRDLSADGRKQLRAALAKQAIAEKKVPNELWRRVEKAIEIDKNLRDMQQAGLDVVYHACDVSDRAAVGAMLDEIRRADGPIEGIVHGAGVESSCRFTKKDPEMVSRTIAAKVDGAAALMESTQSDAVRFFFGFGSISGRWGSIGQSDYAAASDMLAKLIDTYRAEHPDCTAACFHWPPWAEIGMAARDETRGSGMLQMLKLLPAAEGIEWFFDELLAGAPEPEVLVIDWDFYKKFYPDLSDKEIAEVYSPNKDTKPSPGNITTKPSPDRVKPSPDRKGVGNTHNAPQPLPNGRGSDNGPNGRGSESASNGTGSQGNQNQVALRHVMRMVELPLANTSRQPFEFAGPALILGDNADAQALATELGRLGVTVHFIPICDTVDATLSELQWLSAENPAPHLFIMTTRDPEARRIDDHCDWVERRRRGIMLPYAVCQKWLAMTTDAGLLDRASLVAATSLGGDFGFAGSVVAPEGGAMTGLIKGLYTELGIPKPTGAKLKVIDALADEPSEAIAQAVLDELTVDGIDVEVAYQGGRRSVVRMAIEPVETLSREELPRGGTWIFTGGARGITAEVAKVMGRRHGLKLHLLGKSPEPAIDPAWRDFDQNQMKALKRSFVRKATAEGKPPGTYWQRVSKDLEIDRNLREMAAAGIEATYHSCDVGDWEQLELTVERIRQADGPIEGIVHGAGILDEPKPIGDMPLEELEHEIDVKADALLNMMLATEKEPARYYVGFGSISGRFGSNNAIIYSMSSDLLCKLAGWHRGRSSSRSAVGIHWHPWGEVGMMMHPSSQHTIRVMKMRMMPPAEGAEHLIDELRAGLTESEVLITDRQYYETFYSKDLLIPTTTGQAAKPTTAGALVERFSGVEPGRRATAEMRLDPVADPFLCEHRLRDRPTLPMVVALEAFAETASWLAGGEKMVVAVRDVQIPDAVRLLTDEARDARIHAEVTEAGTACRLTSDFRNRRGQLVQKDRLHFSGVVGLAAVPTAIDATLPPARGQWHDMQYPPRDSLLYHGPPLRLLRRIAIEETHAWGQIEFPAENELAGHRDAAGWLTPSAAIDASYYACGVYVWASAEQGVTVPESLAEIRFGRPAKPSEKTTVYVTCRELNEKSALFDFTLFGDDGSVIFQATGYRCHVLRGGPS